MTRLEDVLKMIRTRDGERVGRGGRDEGECSTSAKKESDGGEEARPLFLR